MEIASTGMFVLSWSVEKPKMLVDRGLLDQLIRSAYSICGTRMDAQAKLLRKAIERVVTSADLYPESNKALDRSCKES